MAASSRFATVSEDDFAFKMAASSRFATVSEDDFAFNVFLFLSFLK